MDIQTINENNFIVYRHTTPNGKMYVGVTSRPLNERCGKDGRKYKCQPYFFRAIQKYGWDNIKHEVLMEGLTEEQASLAEQLFIYYWDLTNRDKGYNRTEGGIKGAKHTQETKDKIAKGRIGKRHSEETKRKLSEQRKGEKSWNWGKSPSTETRRKISEAHKGKKCPWNIENPPMKGKKHSEETKKKYSEQRKGEGNNFYGKRHTDESKAKIRNSLPKKSVAQIDMKTGEIINIFVSQKEAERQTGAYHSNIAKCCKGKVKSVNGYVWKYLEDIDDECKTII